MLSLPFTVNEPDELCASMYSFHSSPEEKNKLLYALAQHGIETTVDRAAKKKRIRDWIQESVIQEDDEEEDSGSSVAPTLIARAPVAGHVSSVRAAEKAEKVENAQKFTKQITTTVKDAANKHRDPRTGEIQQGPSEMGARGDKNLAQTNGHHHKLVDVGSQTTSESQKLSGDVRLERNETTYNMTAAAARVPNPRLTAGRRQNSAPEPLATSRGPRTAYNSVAIITLPEASAHTKPLDQINDSGYGSLDKLRATDQAAAMVSPMFHRRLGNGQATQRRDKDRSPFESDSGGDGSPYGSSAYVHHGDSNGVINRSTIITSTMKDTPYDIVKPRRNKYK